uniref:Uncharacterized protein n=1 Tax=Melopsittacus undulatus TaxID=13146 RepID=A0A8V5GLT2_MELUD
MKCLNHFGGYLCLPRSADVIGPAPLAPPPPRPAPPPPRPAPPLPDRGFYVDECSGPPPCRPSQDCINLPGGFECRCPPGYRHQRTECVDEDECRFRWCQHSCANSPGAFSCRCHPGFRLGPDGRSCLDVDECSMGARCSQRCLNTFGSFRCRCRSGFLLQPDGAGCEDVDECAGGAGLCQHRCQNSPGAFTCLCPPGYGVDGVTCVDVDECSEGTHGCSGAQSCINTFGGHRCVPRELCPAPYVPHPSTPRTCVCPGGLRACAPRPRWFLPRFLALPNVPDPPRGLFQIQRPPGSPQRLRLRGGPPGAFRLRVPGGLWGGQQGGRLGGLKGQWGCYGAAMGQLWGSYWAAMGQLLGSYGAAMGQLSSSCYRAAMGQLLCRYGAVIIGQLWGRNHSATIGQL